MIRVFAVGITLSFIAFSADSKKPEIETSLKDASNLLRSGEVRRAIHTFRNLLKTAEDKKDERTANRARVGLAACYLVTHEYKEAVRHGETALRYGISTKDEDVAVRAAMNLSSVYRMMGDFPAAAQTMRDLNPLLPQITNPQVKAPLYIHAATNSARTGDWARAEPLFLTGIETAIAAGEMQMAAIGWNQLGYMRLQNNELAKADAALTEAFRIRRLAGNKNLGASYTYLGMLRLAQGDARSALNLLTRAIDIGSKTNVSIPLPTLFYYRARARTALAEVAGALSDYDQAVSWATQWRNEVLSSDSLRISAEVSLDKIFRDYVQTGMLAWSGSKDQALARRMFEVSEQHRTASFRELTHRQRELPAEYWEALVNYRNALIASLGSGSKETADKTRLRLTSIEASLGLSNRANVPATVAAVQRRLSADEALISFETGKDQSFAWAVTRDGFEPHILAGLGEIAPVAGKYRDAVEKDTAFDGSNTRLYSLLFGNLSSRIQAKGNWLLSLDQGLYDIPYAALGPANTPLILFHSIRALPGASLLNRPVDSARRSTDFVGAGDAVYNIADPRWTGPKNVAPNSYARLVNTRQEVITVAKAWNSDREPTLLFGPEFNRAALDRAFRSEPAIVHIAAHVVRGEANASNVLIGIGLSNDGKPDFLTTADIAARPVRVGLVSISGCASGSGASLPGSGLIGLTRAWLLSGATAVAATYWPVNDDRGDLFSGMYRDIAKSAPLRITSAVAARALQSAQIEAIRSASPRSRPAYWAAVFIAGKS